jgi:SOS response regulatory protein OraA/RecX
LLEMGDEIAAALGRAGVHDEFADRVIERAQQRDLLRLSRGRDAQIRTRLRPGAGEIRVRQRLALIAVEQDDIAGFSLLLA